MTVSASCSILYSPFHILPSRLQLFEYESVNFTCEGFNVSAGWKVRNIQETISECSHSTWIKTCGIDYALAADSGEYWCESGAQRSDNVTITVSTGSVILDSPVHPVMEGEAVILSCRNKTTSSNFIAHFYRDDFLIGTGFEGQMELQNVTKSQEGHYKCKIHGVGESPESWMSIKIKYNRENNGLQRDACLFSENFLHRLLLLRVVFTVVTVALLVLLVGLLHCGKLGFRPKMDS